MRLHITLHLSGFLNLSPGNFGTRFMKDALAVKHLVISLLVQQDNKAQHMRDYTRGLELFVSAVKSKRPVLNIFFEPSSQNIRKNLTNDQVEEFKLLASCKFQALLNMRNLKKLPAVTRCAHGHGRSLGRQVSVEQDGRSSGLSQAGRVFWGQS